MSKFKNDISLTFLNKTVIFVYNYTHDNIFKHLLYPSTRLNPRSLNPMSTSEAQKHFSLQSGQYPVSRVNRSWCVCRGSVQMSLSSRRCVWFCAIAALSGSKAQPPLLDYYPLRAGKQGGEIRHIHTHKTNTLDGYTFLNKLPKGQVKLCMDIWMKR